MIERCKECGAAIALVGLKHNCIPKKNSVKNPDRIVIDDPGYDPTASSSWIGPLRERLKDVKPVVIMSRLHEADIPGVILEGDLGFKPLKIPFDRKIYQREYMRKWRAKQRESK